MNQFWMNDFEILIFNTLPVSFILSTSIRQISQPCRVGVKSCRKAARRRGLMLALDRLRKGSLKKSDQKKLYSVHEPQYDGHTLKSALKQMMKLIGHEVEMAICDLCCRWHDYEGKIRFFLFASGFA